MFNIVSKKLTVGSTEITLETGRFARQADGAVMVRHGDSMVLVTAVMSKSQRDMGFLPLTVDFVEKTYAAGKIPGGFFKREGRPTENEILTSRLIDRPLRPLFDNSTRNEIQILATNVSTDRENDPALLGIIGASAALMISDIPWDGPVAAVRVGRIDGEFVINPAMSTLAQSELDIIVVVGGDGVVMVEGQADFLSEQHMIDALMFAQEQAQPILAIQREMAAEIGKTKRVLAPVIMDEALKVAVFEKGQPLMEEALQNRVKLERYAALSDAKARLLEMLVAENEDFAGKDKDFGVFWSELLKKTVRGWLFDEGKRVDGRTTQVVRPIYSEVGILPRVHGSALFTRGETQALVAVTLGTAQDEQRIDALAGEDTRSFMLHYNFPPFSVGEVKPVRGPSRRDIGHGMLAQRGTQRLLPDKDVFPYTIRIVSEILESNGSSSMATVCGTVLALMDAGVPLKGMVAGIAMGLMKEGDRVEVLTDILGDEDHLGDMDFKVVGSEEGISAIQMDIKISGLSKEILTRALAQARDARIHIMGEMKKALDKPRDELSPYAPRIATLHINTERIKDLIGPGGKHIKGIIERTGAMIDVTDDGTVHVASVDPEAQRLAIEMINSYTAEAEIGAIYEGVVARVVDFGAFITIMPGTDGLCHISELAEGRVDKVEDVMKTGDKVLVKVLEIDSRSGKIRLSHRAALRERTKN